MTFPVQCGSCGARFSVPEHTLQDDPQGKRGSVACPLCGLAVSIGGTVAGSEQTVTQEAEAAPSSQRVPRPQDFPARPAVVVGAKSSTARGFKATMMGVAPPAPAPGSTSVRGAAAGASTPVGTSPDATKAAASEGARRPPPPRRGGTMLGLNPPGGGPALSPPRAVVGFEPEQPAVAPLAPLNLEGVVDLAEHELDSLPPGPLEVEGISATGTPITDIPVATVTRSEAPPPNLSASPGEFDGLPQGAPYYPPVAQFSPEVSAASLGSAPYEPAVHHPLPPDITAPPKAIPRPAPPPKSRGGGSVVLWLGAFLLSVVGIGCVFYFLLPNSDVARTLRGWVSDISDGNSGGHAVAKTGVIAPSAGSALVAPSATTAAALLVDSVGSGSAGAPGLALSASATVANSAEAANSVAPEVASAAPLETASAAASGASPGSGGAGAEAPAAQPVNSTIPEGVDPSRLLYLMQLAIKRAEQCHLGGRAVGTAQVFASFGVDGRVTDVRLEGEPIASAPVATCVVNKIKAVLIKPYEGAPFVYETTLTLR